MSSIESTAIYMIRKPTTEATYTTARQQDIYQARTLYRKYREVKYYNGWVMIGGIVVNGISKREMQKIEKEIDREN